VFSGGVSEHVYDRDSRATAISVRYLAVICVTT
jgi:hypothetical protein